MTIIKFLIGSYESLYNSSRSSTPPNLTTAHTNNMSINNNSTSTINPSPNSSVSASLESPNNSRSSYSSAKPELADKYSDSNQDLTATATSNIQLNNTDDLTTQVDYYLNEVKSKFILF